MYCGGHIAIAKNHNAGSRSGFRRCQIDGGIAVDRYSWPAVAGLFRKNECHTTARDRRPSVDRETASVNIINAGVQGHIGARIERNPVAIDAGIDRDGRFGGEFLLIAAKKIRK